KTGLFSLFGTRYQVGPELARRRIDVYFDPEDLTEIEVHSGGRFVERCVPFEVQQHRRPRAKTDEPSAPAEDATVTADWLGHLTRRRREEAFVPSAPDIADADAGIVALLRERLD